MQRCEVRRSPDGSRGWDLEARRRLERRLIQSRGGNPFDAFLTTVDQPWFRALSVSTILDIGAHTGSFSALMSVVFPGARIYAFEPLKDCYQRLTEQFSAYPNFTAYNVALSDNTGESVFFRSSFAPSSSLLEMASLHKDAFPYSAERSKMTVRTVRLDQMSESLDIRGNVLVKIDVQGAELRILKGGDATIGRAAILIIETTFETLYQGGPLFDDIYRRLTDRGFRYRGSMDRLLDPRTGRVIQEDSIFLREDILATGEENGGHVAGSN